MARHQRTGRFLGYLTHSPVREEDEKKSRYLTRRVIELSAPKSRKYQDGTYDFTWGSQAPIRQISSATLTVGIIINSKPFSRNQLIVLITLQS